mgnify:CR=1 FL=1
MARADSEAGERARPDGVFIEGGLDALVRRRPERGSLTVTSEE